MRGLGGMTGMVSEAWNLPAAYGPMGSGPAEPDLTYTTNLHLWLKANAGVYSDAGSTPAANGDTVQQWNDQSGNGWNAAQATASRRPTYRTNAVNGYPAVDFLAAVSEDMLALSGGGLGLGRNVGGQTVFVVFTTTAASGKALWEIEKADSGGTRTACYIGQSNAGDVFLGYRRLDADGIASLASSGGLVSADTYYYVTAKFDFTNASWQIWLNGSSIAGPSSKGTSGNSQDADAGFVLIGASQLAGAGCLDGRIAELLFYGEACSDANRGTVETYLATKYGL